jgi:hypothetical protein
MRGQEGSTQLTQGDTDAGIKLRIGRSPLALAALIPFLPSSNFALRASAANVAYFRTRRKGSLPWILD